MENQYLRIKKAEVVPDKFGSHLKITMVGLYEVWDGEEKWVRWVKLNQALADKLLGTDLKIEL